MDMQRFIVMNMLLEVYDKEDQLYYKSIVQEVNDASFAIGIPMAERKKLIMPPNTTWTFRTTLKDALYYFNSGVIGHTTSGDVLLFQIAWPKKAERYQRRDFFRLSTFLDLRFWVLGEDEPRLDPEMLDNDFINNLGESEKAIGLDISGGGILMVSPRQLSRGAILLLEVYFYGTNKTETLLVQGKIVREEVSVEAGVTRYCYGLSFENISKKLREQIVQYIFAITRERARKGG